MQRPLLDRRRFLQAAGLTFSSLLSERQAFALQSTDALYASCFQKPDGSQGFALLNEQGDIVTEHRLIGRGHGFTTSPANGWNVAFARSPGNFAYAFRADGRNQPVAFAAPEGRHFYGHGAFSPDGKILYATESDYEAGQGIIGLYEVANGFARAGEFASHGIGPHEMILAPDGQGLWIANGGILTHPSTGKTKLNLDTMRSNIALVDLKDGSVRQIHDTPASLQRLSLRHMAVAKDGTVWIGSQHEGSATDAAPLIARIGNGKPLGFVDVPDNARLALKNYVGSVAASGDGKRIGFTSPVGNVLLVLDAESGNVVDRQDHNLICGISGAGAGFVYSTEAGLIGSKSWPRLWDNHIRAM